MKESTSLFDYMNIDKDKLFENIVNIKNIANLSILKCYKVLFSINGIKKNIGSFIIIFIIIFHFICIILFYYKNLSIIQDKIKDIAFGITNWKLLKQNKRIKKKIEKEKLIKEKEEKMNINNDNINNIENKEIFLKNEIKLENKDDYQIPNLIPNLITNNDNPNFENKDNNLKPSKKVKEKNKMIVINNYLNFVNDKNQNESVNINKSLFTLNQLSPKESIIKKSREIMAYNDTELNQLSYKLALKYDKRAFCEYYLSLIKTKHNLIFSFFYNKDFNARIIKIDLFFIDFVMFVTVNALFFDDDTMHKIYIDKGKYDFAYQIPIIIYSSIISYVLDTLLQLLALSEDSILDFKKKKIKKNLDKRSIDLYNKLKIMFLLYFIIGTIILLVFWYYSSMFCAIYQNTQIHLIKDT